jgi:hypothetical protein
MEAVSKSRTNCYKASLLSLSRINFYNFNQKHQPQYQYQSTLPSRLQHIHQYAIHFRFHPARRCPPSHHSRKCTARCSMYLLPPPHPTMSNSFPANTKCHPRPTSKSNKHNHNPQLNLHNGHQELPIHIICNLLTKWLDEWRPPNCVGVELCLSTSDCWRCLCGCMYF